MEQADPAAQLAHATLESARHATREPFQQAIRDLQPSAEIVSEALALCVAEPPFQSHGAASLMLRDYLQFVLTRDHIAAQRRMGRTVTWLNWILVALTIALVWFAWVGYRGGQARAKPADAQVQADGPQGTTPPRSGSGARALGRL